MLDSLQQAKITQAICKRLGIVIDPELGRNVIEMGLICMVEVDVSGAVEITMTTTFEGCPAASFLVEGVRASAAKVDGVTDVSVALTYEPRWQPQMMAS